MEALAWRRRRRRALAVLAACLAAVAAIAVAALLDPVARSLVVPLLIVALVLHLVGLRARRPRRQLARLDAVVHAAGDDAAATAIEVDARVATGWLGARGWTTALLVLVDDARGLAVWDVRGGRPVEVARWPWSAVARAVVREGGACVDLEPTAHGWPVVRVVPTGFRGDPPQLWQTPSRSLAFAARMHERLHAWDPIAHPPVARRARDVEGWGRPTA